MALEAIHGVPDVHVGLVPVVLADTVLEVGVGDLEDGLGHGLGHLLAVHAGPEAVVVPGRDLHMGAGEDPLDVTGLAGPDEQRGAVAAFVDDGEEGVVEKYPHA